jgi:hypothetical protein
VVNARPARCWPLYTEVLDDIDSRSAQLDIEAAAGAAWRHRGSSCMARTDEAVPVAEAERLPARSRAPCSSASRGRDTPSARDIRGLGPRRNSIGP